MHFWNIPHIWMLYVALVLAVVGHYYNLYLHKQEMKIVRGEIVDIPRYHVHSVSRNR